MPKKRANSGRRKGTGKKIESPGRRNFLWALLAIGAAGVLAWWNLRDDAQTSEIIKPPPKKVVIPSEKILARPLGEYGTIVEQIRPEAPHQLYIVAQKHRLTEEKEKLKSKPSGPYNLDIGRVQTSVYRILEELMHERAVKLFLHEGAFTKDDHETAYAAGLPNRRRQLRADPRTESVATHPLDNDLTLFFGYKEGSPFAEPIPHLRLIYDGIVMQGWDHEHYHKLVDEFSGRSIAAFKAGKYDLALELMAYVDYFHIMRSGYGLLNAPLMAHKEYEKGRIPNLNTAMVVGLIHFDELLEFVRNDRVVIEGISTPEWVTTEKDLYEGMDVALNYPLLGFPESQGFGVTFIRPNNLPPTHVKNVGEVLSEIIAKL